MTDKEYLNSIADAIKALKFGANDTDIVLRIRELLECAGYKF